MDGEKMIITIPATLTLIGGILIGYLGQRSRFCLPSGIRDFYLIKDLYRIKALPGIFIGAFGSFLILSKTGWFTLNFPLLWDIRSWLSVTLAAIGGLGLGFFSALAEGCPFRQFVMASEGEKTAIAYLLGFFIGIIYFNIVLSDIIKTLTALLG